MCFALILQQPESLCDSLVQYPWSVSRPLKIPRSWLVIVSMPNLVYACQTKCILHRLQDINQSGKISTLGRRRGVWGLLSLMPMDRREGVRPLNIPPSHDGFFCKTLLLLVNDVGVHVEVGTDGRTSGHIRTCWWFKTAWIAASYTLSYIMRLR